MQTPQISGANVAHVSRPTNRRARTQTHHIALKKRNAGRLLDQPRPVPTAPMATRHPAAAKAGASIDAVADH